MNQQPSKVTIGETVPLDRIESAFRQYWRDAGQAGSNEAVLKASTINLVIFVDTEKKYQELLEDIHEVISHHPGRIIIAFVDAERDESDIEAHVSAYTRKSKESVVQIAAELVILKTGEPGVRHLAGAILPLLLPDLPVYFWCTSLCALDNPQFKTLLRFTDRLIVTTPWEYDSVDDMAKAFNRILALDQECNVSDMSWSELTNWREAVAQFFDSDINQKYLRRLDEIEITYSSDNLSNHAFLFAGWLSSQLRNISSATALEDESTIYFKRQSERLPIKLRKKKLNEFDGLYKIKLLSEENEKSVIFTATAQTEGPIRTTVQKGGNLVTTNYVSSRLQDKIEMLCNELDFIQQDLVYLKACQSIAEYLNEK